MIRAQSLENGRLCQAQIDAYWQDGFLFPLPAIPPEEALHMRAELETVERDWLDADLPRPLNVYKRVNAHCVMPFAFRIASDPRILDIVEGILGPDILIYGVEFFIKESGTGQIVSMHQDLTYWGLGATSRMVTAWVALSPATPASGCMQFVRGSHKNPILPHQDTFDTNNLLSRGQEIQVEVAQEDRIPIEIHPGQMSLHHGLTIHGSGPNTSTDRRIAAVIRYMTPEVRQHVAERDFAVLVRGVDRIGNFIHYTPSRRLFEPSALTLHDEIRAAQVKATMRGADSFKGLYA